MYHDRGLDSCAADWRLGAQRHQSDRFNFRIHPMQYRCFCTFFQVVLLAYKYPSLFSFCRYLPPFCSLLPRDSARKRPVWPSFIRVSIIGVWPKTRTPDEAVGRGAACSVRNASSRVAIICDMRTGGRGRSVIRGASLGRGPHACMRQYSTKRRTGCDKQTQGSVTNDAYLAATLYCITVRPRFIGGGTGTVSATLPGPVGRAGGARWC
ncbi:hypothetical protein EDB86DRAFT_257692 [Lactarius hatsudake]|nr:hypothetical protein EDB86DRAFT_257692 [Lactarius hatsudake]